MQTVFKHLCTIHRFANALIPDSRIKINRNRMPFAKLVGGDAFSRKYRGYAVTAICDLMTGKYTKLSGCLRRPWLQNNVRSHRKNLMNPQIFPQVHACAHRCNNSNIYALKLSHSSQPIALLKAHAFTSPQGIFSNQPTCTKAATKEKCLTACSLSLVS